MASMTQSQLLLERAPGANIREHMATASATALLSQY
jgi:hypothetical protein